MSAQYNWKNISRVYTAGKLLALANFIIVLRLWGNHVKESDKEYELHKPKYGHIQAKGTVELKADPNINSISYETLFNNSDIIIRNDTSNKEWVEVTSRGTQGWVLRKYVVKESSK